MCAPRQAGMRRQERASFIVQLTRYQERNFSAAIRDRSVCYLSPARCLPPAGLKPVARIIRTMRQLRSLHEQFNPGKQLIYYHESAPDPRYATVHCGRARAARNPALFERGRRACGSDLPASPPDR